MLTLFYTFLGLLVLSLGFYALKTFILHSDNTKFITPANNNTELEGDSSYDDFICMMLSDGTTIFGVLDQKVTTNGV